MNFIDVKPKFNSEINIGDLVKITYKDLPNIDYGVINKIFDFKIEVVICNACYANYNLDKIMSIDVEQIYNNEIKLEFIKGKGVMQ